MKLIVIYGPPAAGKLTVAEELVQFTGYKLFHNHATIDVFGSVFEYGTEVFWKLVEDTRLKVFEEAAKHNISLIFTIVYAKGEDDQYMKKICDTVERNNGEVCFVQLTCDKNELKKRVLEESRKKFNKISTFESIDKIMEKYDLFSKFPSENSLSIDNTVISPDYVAKQIKSHFSL